MGKPPVNINPETLRYYYCDLKLSGLETARRLCIGRTTLSRYLKAYGIPERNISQVRQTTKWGHTEEHKQDLSKQMKLTQKGTSNRNWKGGSWIDDEGYRRIRVNGQYVKEHRHVMEEHLGRKLNGYQEHVHHKDGNKLNNTIDNLVVLSPEAHSQLHWSEESKRANQSAKITELRATRYWSSKKKV